MRIRLSLALFAIVASALCSLATGFFVGHVCAAPPPEPSRPAPPKPPAAVSPPARQQPASVQASVGQVVPSGSVRRTAVVAAVDRQSPSVVAIFTEERPRQNPFAGMFGVPDPEELFDRPRANAVSLGSGVIVDPRGYVVTNEHVVAGAARIRVQLADGRELPAQLVGADAAFDLAVLKVESRGPLPTATLGTARDLMPGETVIAIGNPFGLAHTVTTGVISALHRVVKTPQRIYEDFIQTDAAINPGNSGGPLLNLTGELIGINTAVHRGGPGIGFAIPIDRAKTIVDDLLRFGRVRYGWLGLRVRSARGGVVVVEVEDGSPAQAAGIRRGDVVVSFAGEPTTNVSRYLEHVERVLAGDEIVLGLARGTVKLRAVGLEPAQMAARLRKRLGVEVTQIQGRRGAWVTRVARGSVGEQIGLHVGDAILQLGSREIRGVDDFSEALGALRGDQDTVLLVGRGQFAYYVTISL